MASRLRTTLTSRTSWQTSDSDFDQSQFRAEMQSGIRFVHGYEPEWIVPGANVDHARKRLKTFLDWTASQPHSPSFLSVMIDGATAFRIPTSKQSWRRRSWMSST